MGIFPFFVNQSRFTQCMCLKVIVCYKRGDLHVCKKWLHKIMVVTPCSQLLIWKHQFCSRKSLEWWQFAAQKLFTPSESEDSPGLVGRGYEKGEMTIVSYVNVVLYQEICYMFCWSLWYMPDWLIKQFLSGHQKRKVYISQLKKGKCKPQIP